MSNEFWKKKYEQAEPIPAKYLHSDGTINETSGGGSGADLEDNHETTIDVSSYNQPVEINPTSGKVGMKKATVTLSNIPSGGDSATLYCWVNNSNSKYYTLNSVAPQTQEEFEAKWNNVSNIYTGDGISYARLVSVDLTEGSPTMTRTSDTEFVIGSETITRASSYDITIN